MQGAAAHLRPDLRWVATCTTPKEPEPAGGQQQQVQDEPTGPLVCHAKHVLAVTWL
jgi:hypothetical protein